MQKRNGLYLYWLARLANFSAIGIRDFSLFEGSGGYELADGHPQLLGCLYNLCCFLFRVIGEQSLSHGRMQSSATNGRAFTHIMNVSKRPPNARSSRTQLATVGIVGSLGRFLSSPDFVN